MLINKIKNVLKTTELAEKNDILPTTFLVAKVLYKKECPLGWVDFGISH